MIELLLKSLKKQEKQLKEKDKRLNGMQESLDKLFAINQDLSAEIERLREALEDIVRLCPPCNEDCMGIDANVIATKALKEDK